MRSSALSCLALAAAITATFTAATVPALAQTQSKPDNYGGLGGYPVPEAGGPDEFKYCVIYAKRAWRAANLIDEGGVTASQVKDWARQGLGKTAAAEEVDDFEKFSKKEFPSSDAMAAERFQRCATHLRLNPEPRHKPNAEFCFRSIKPLDFVARMRADGTDKARARDLAAKRYGMPAKQLDQTVALAYSGPSLQEDSMLIEDTFSTCFAEAGERQLKK